MKWYLLFFRPLKLLSHLNREAHKLFIMTSLLILPSYTSVHAACQSTSQFIGLNYNSCEISINDVHLNAYFLSEEECIQICRDIESLLPSEKATRILIEASIQPLLNPTLTQAMPTSCQEPTMTQSSLPLHSTSAMKAHKTIAGITPKATRGLDKKNQCASLQEMIDHEALNTSNCGKLNYRKEVTKMRKTAQSWYHLLRGPLSPEDQARKNVLIFILTDLEDDPDGVFMICNSDGEIVSMGTYSDEQESIHLDNLVSHPDQTRYKGGGRAALLEMLRESICSNKHEITLESLTTAVSFYEKFGFTRTPTETNPHLMRLDNLTGLHFLTPSLH